MRNVTVVIPTYNGARFIRMALESVFVQTQLPEEIILVDDSSTDETVEIVSNAFPQVTLIRRFQNGGFGETCNQGIQHALNRGATHVMLLNQDAIVDQSTCDALFKLLEKHEKFGLIACVQLNYNGDALDSEFRCYFPATILDEAYFGRLQRSLRSRICSCSSSHDSPRSAGNHWRFRSFVLYVWRRQ